MSDPQDWFTVAVRTTPAAPVAGSPQVTLTVTLTAADASALPDIDPVTVTLPVDPAAPGFAARNRGGLPAGMAPQGWILSQTTTDPAGGVFAFSATPARSPRRSNSSSTGSPPPITTAPPR